MRYALRALLILLLMPCVAFADVTLSGGEWSTTFNCADWTDHASPCGPLSCGGVKTTSCTGPIEGHEGELSVAGNNSGGGGYKGFRKWIPAGSGIQGGTIGLQIDLTAPVNEMWYRYYARYSTTLGGSMGQKLSYGSYGEIWRTNFYNGISLFARGVSNPSSQMWHQPAHDGDACGGTHFSNSASSFATIMGGSTGDGLWHAYETHLKRETSGCNGVFEQWVDGVLVNQHTGICLAMSIQYWGMWANQDQIATSGWLDIDDLAISTNGYIGLLGGGGPTPDTVPNAFSFVDNTNVAKSAVIYSTTIQVTGIDDPSPIQITGTGCSYRKNGTGSWLTAADNVVLNDNVALKTTSSAVDDTDTSCTLNIGGIQDDWHVRTIPGSHGAMLSETFESQNMNNWMGNWVPGTEAFVTSPVHGGTYALRTNVRATAGDYTHLFGDHPQIGDAQVTDFTSEEYIYFQNPFTWDTVGIHMWTLNAFEAWGAGYSTANGQGKPNSWAPYYITVGIVNSGELFMYLVRADGLPGGATGAIWENHYQNQGQTYLISPGQWYKVKYRAKLNTPGSSNGIFQMWLNDTLIEEYTNLNYRASYTTRGWNYDQMRFDGSGSMPNPQYIYRDDITLYSGDPASPPPAAPTNIVISPGVSYGGGVTYK